MQGTLAIRQADKNSEQFQAIVQPFKSANTYSTCDPNRKFLFFGNSKVHLWKKEMGVTEQMKEWESDLPAVMKILALSNDVRDTVDLLSLLNSKVADLLKHDAMICGYQVLSSSGSYVHNILQHNYPVGYAESLATTDGRSDSPLIQLWRATHEPVVFQSGRDDEKYPAEWVKVFNAFNLRNIIGHGVLDVRGTFGSYFVFARIPGEVGEREKFFLKLITPHLHLALMRAMENGEQFKMLPEPGSVKLSERQKEILRRINQGKTSREIAHLLSMTEKNVKYHIEQIFIKLGVRSRAQAISKAILLGLLD
jgi:transcriptional regulator EpsA